MSSNRHRLACLCATIEMKDFDGLYLPLFAQLRTAEELGRALATIRHRLADEKLVILALAYGVGLLDISCMSKTDKKAIVYIEQRYRESWCHARYLQ